jgi:hypothetical protein
MRFLPENNPDRREFFRDAARYGFLGMLAVIASLSGRANGLQGQRCINRGLCGNCKAFTDCELPQALSAKQSRGPRLQDGQKG